MARNRKHKNRGMTLTEVLFAFVIGTMLIGIVLGMWYFAYRNWAVERIRSTLRTNLEIALERIKDETRLSTTSYTSRYQGETGYIAISFPMATADANGFFTLDAGGKIYWDRSVIYHMYPNLATGHNELRRTEFTNNHAILVDTAEREAQLISVVENGNGDSAPNASNSSMKVIFENLVDMAITTEAGTFDGYSPTERRSENVEFGSIRLDPGNHSLRFEVTGQNASSLGYEIGIDTLSITPSGCKREAEVCAVSATSGDTASIESLPAVGWSGNMYREYRSDAIGDHITFSLYYDEWLECNFDNSIRENTILTGDNLYVQLADATQAGEICWQASVQTGSDGADFVAPFTGVTIRNIISGGSIDRDGSRISVKFTANSIPGNTLTIDGAWVTQMSPLGTGDDYDGTGTPLQLLFNSLSGVVIPGGQETWSDWAEFPVTQANNYFVTFYMSAASYVTYWQGPVTDPPTVNSYFQAGNRAQSNDWTHSDEYPVTNSPGIYAVESAENWVALGTVQSAIYDTRIDSDTAPAYNNLSWDSYVPAGASVSMQVRASDNSDMSSATGWASTSNGGSLSSSLDGKRYVQFKAALTSGFPYTDYPRIDNVSIQWPGAPKICDISGFFAQKPDYAKIKLTVDGQEPTKGYTFKVTVFDYFQGKRYDASLTAEVEPRNAGR
ncbi:MAG: prepilin-type N-terminal cleavage/methylation domain-containing protein [Candidatus Omnitrophota bacterium]